jgi:hypothetical protein
VGPEQGRQAAPVAFTSDCDSRTARRRSARGIADELDQDLPPVGRSLARNVSEHEGGGWRHRQPPSSASFRPIPLVPPTIGICAMAPYFKEFANAIILCSLPGLPGQGATGMACRRMNWRMPSSRKEARSIRLVTGL